MITFSITFICRPSKADSKGLAPIEVSLSVNGERTYINTSRKCKPCDFDNNRQTVKRDKGTNEFLHLVKTKLYQCQTELIKENMDVTAKAIKELYLNDMVIVKKRFMLSEAFQSFIKTLELKTNNGQLAPRTFDKYIATTRNIKEYLIKEFDNKDIAVEDINYTFVDNFFNYLRQSKSHNTALKELVRVEVCSIGEATEFLG